MIITVRDRESERRKQQRQMESPSQPQHVIFMKELYYYTQRMIMVKRQARTSYEMRTIHLQALDIMVAARVSISIQRMFRALQQP